jgi:hypothetical protein
MMGKPGTGHIYARLTFKEKERERKKEEEKLRREKDCSEVSEVAAQPACPSRPRQKKEDCLLLLPFLSFLTFSSDFLNPLLPFITVNRPSPDADAAWDLWHSTEGRREGRAPSHRVE